MTTAGTLVQDPQLGYTLAPGSDMSPVPSGPSIGSLGISAGGSPQMNAMGTAPTQGSNPYTIFNQQVAAILAKLQQGAAQGRNNLGGAINSLTNESVGAAGAYNPQAAPSVNIQNNQGTMGAFAPALTSLNTQLANANEGVKDLTAAIPSLVAPYQPQAVSPGQSLVTPSGQNITQGHSYTPALNPNTGMMDGFDQNTGTWASDDSKGGGTSSGIAGSTPATTPGQTGQGIVAGVDLSGASVGMKPYATDPNYVSEVQGTYNSIKQTLPLPSMTAEGIDQYIDRVAPKSQVTGQQILNASSTYGVDPYLLLAVAQHESDFGTQGAASNTNNPFNVGNTGTSTQSYNSVSAGVLGGAAALAKRSTANAQGSSQAPTQPTSTVGADFSPQAAQKVQQLPSAYQPYVDAGPLGVAYINDDRVPAAAKQGLQTLAARAGIPYVQAGDVGALKSIGTVLNNLDAMQALAAKNLGSGTLGHIADATLGAGAQALQTGWGIQLGLFDNYRDTAIKAVQALAGGAGSGLRINMGEIAANTQNLPQASDSQQNAVAQIKQLRQLIYTQLGATFPYAQVKVSNPQGQTGTIPVGNMAAALQEGYTIQ